MQRLCKRAQREFTLCLPSAAKYYANINKSLVLRYKRIHYFKYYALLCIHRINKQRKHLIIKTNDLERIKYVV